MINFPFLSSKSFAIDLGNSNTLLTNHDGVLMRQPSYIAFDATTHQVKAVGDAAYDMYERIMRN
jgi:rod shape-determining protein MreB